jgi:hypothetical protein
MLLIIILRSFIDTDLRIYLRLCCRFLWREFFSARVISTFKLISNDIALGVLREEAVND